MTRDLLGSNLRIFKTRQQPFNIDTILLANFANPTKDLKTIYDLGTGAGSLALYMAYKTSCKIVGIEIQKDFYEEALKNVKLNDLEHQITILNEDIKNLPQICQDIDAIIVNPPFFKIIKQTKISEMTHRAIARHEVQINLHELLVVSRQILKANGKLYMIHRPERLSEIIDECKKNRLEVKKIRFVHSYLRSESNHVLIEATKDGLAGLKVLKPLILYQEDGTLTAEMTKIYQDITFQ